jgi:hypothetical protein
MSRLTPIIIVTAIVAAPASADWRDEKIDGTNATAFERSISLLLTELPRRRREEFEIALSLIWLNNTVDVGGANHDGDFNPDDVRQLQQVAEDLLAEIKRGDVLAAIEKRDETGGNYTSVQYFEQLDGLQFAEVLDLAGQPSTEPAMAAIKREVWCRSPRFLGSSRARHSWCDGENELCQRCIRRTTMTVFNAAEEAFEAQQYSDARAEIEGLDFDWLNAFERSNAERFLSVISYAERDLLRAREHLQNAIDVGGLSSEGELEIRRQISLLDSQISAIPQPE